jgi:hypothetical protein
VEKKVKLEEGETKKDFQVKIKDFFEPRKKQVRFKPGKFDKMTSDVTDFLYPVFKKRRTIRGRIAHRIKKIPVFKRIWVRGYVRTHRGKKISVKGHYRGKGKRKKKG